MFAPLTILQHFGNFNVFAMSDNIHTGYHIAIPDDIWRKGEQQGTDIPTYRGSEITS